MLNRSDWTCTGSPIKSEIVTWSACAFETPAATVPTPSSDTNLTLTLASGLRFSNRGLIGLNLQ